MTRMNLHGFGPQLRCLFLWLCLGCSIDSGLGLSRATAQSTQVYDEVVLQGGKRFRGTIIEETGEGPRSGSIRFQTLAGETYVFSKQSVSQIRRDVGQAQALRRQQRAAEEKPLIASQGYGQIVLAPRIGYGPLRNYDRSGEREAIGQGFRALDVQFEFVLFNTWIINPAGFSVYWDGSWSYYGDTGLRLHLANNRQRVRPFIQGRLGMGMVSLADNRAPNSILQLTSPSALGSDLVFSGNWDVSFGLDLPRVAFDVGYSRQWFVGHRYDLMSNALFFRSNFEFH